MATREAFHTDETLGSQATMAPSTSPSSLRKGHLRKVDRAQQSRRGLKPDFWVNIALPEENLVQLLCLRVSGHNMLTSHFLQRLRKKENTKTRIYTKVRMHMYFVRAYNMFNSEAVISRKEFFGLLPTSLGGGSL